MNAPTKPSYLELNRKLYAAPRLRIYGDILTMTQAVGTTSMHRDVAGMGTNKTH